MMRMVEMLLLLDLLLLDVQVQSAAKVSVRASAVTADTVTVRVGQVWRWRRMWMRRQSQLNGRCLGQRMQKR